MAISINDNLAVQANKPIDARYGPYSGGNLTEAITAANNAIPAARRFMGLVVGLNINSIITDYWYETGIDNSHLVVKQVAPTDFSGATPTTAGTAGFVPAPAAGYDGRFLRGDASWVDIPAPTPADIGAANALHNHNELYSLDETQHLELKNNGELTLPNGGSISDSEAAEGSITLTPPNAGAGQGLVIRPTAALWSISSSGFIVYGSPITISVSQLAGGNYFGTINYSITGSGVTQASLGRALTGAVVFSGNNGPETETITWAIPANSDITEFTLTLTSVDGTRSTNISTENDPALYFNFEYNAMPTGQFVTVTNDGISNSEHSHVHLISANPSTVDIYLGDDDQYVKIERNSGGIVIGNNNNTNQWNFKTGGDLEIPAAGDITKNGTPAYAAISHKSTHATDGTDALTPEDIGAQPAGAYAFQSDVDGKVTAYVHADEPVTNVAPAAIELRETGDYQSVALKLDTDNYNDLDPEAPNPWQVTRPSQFREAISAQIAGSYATLVGGLVPSTQLPSYVDDVLEYSRLDAFPGEGETGKIYVAKNFGLIASAAGYDDISEFEGQTGLAVLQGGLDLGGRVSVIDGQIVVTDSGAGYTAGLLGEFEGGTRINLVLVGKGLSRVYRYTGGVDGVYVEISPSEVASVNNKTGAVVLTPADIGATAIGHTHAIADTTNLQASLDVKTEKIKITTFAGADAGYIDGPLSSARFNFITGIIKDATGNFYVTDRHSVRKISASGVVSTVAGAEASGFINAIGASARFSTLKGIVQDSLGNLYVSDTQNRRIRKIDSAGNVTTFAGSGTSGTLDGTGGAASFHSPHGLAIDTNNNIYVADINNTKIRKITPAGVVTSLDVATSFSIVYGVAVDKDNNIYVADRGNGRVVKILPDLSFVVVASALPTNINGISIDKKGNIYLIPYSTVLKVSGTSIETIGGNGSNGYADGGLLTSRFGTSDAVFADPNNKDIYVGDDTRLRKISIFDIDEPVYKAGDTMTGKLNLPASTTASAPLNLGSGTNPTLSVAGDIWIEANNLVYMGSTNGPFVATCSNRINEFVVPQSISVGNPQSQTTPAFKITQKGDGEAFRVEDDAANPDTTPFVISNVGRVGIGVAPDATVALKVDSTGIKFSNDSIQTTAALGLSAGSYIIAKPGDDLNAKYTAAKALTPTATNRVSLIIFPGTYTLAADLSINAEFVDIIGLGGQTQKPAVLIDGGFNTVDVDENDIYVYYAINVSANNVRVSGISTYGRFNGAGGLSQVFENCVGGDYSFGGGNVGEGGTMPGTSAAGLYVNCVGGKRSFGGSESDASGTFISCTGGDFSFGGEGLASGVFTNCTGGYYSFGSGTPGAASGTFVDCTGGDFSLGGEGTASGVFTNCTGGEGSFGGAGTASGVFTACVGGDNSLGGYGTASGVFTNCTGGTYSFGYNDTASGTFTGCTGGAYSFGGDGTASGSFIECRLTLGTFQSLTASPLVANISGVTKTNPVRITAASHRLQTGDPITITGVVGMTQLNNRTFTITRINGGEFRLNGENGTNHSTYISGGQFSIPTHRRIVRMINCIDGGGDVIEGKITA